ncbi:hypothetical protein ACSBR1_036928 [Camellia fascicularis]
MSSFKSPLSLASSVDGSSSDRMGLSHHPSGEIHVIVGPMFAGKTTALLRRVESEGNNGRNVAIIKSSKDTRYAVDLVVTHDGTKFPCWALPDLLSFRQKFGDEAYAKWEYFGASSWAASPEFWARHTLVIYKEDQRERKRI